MAKLEPGLPEYIRAGYSCLFLRTVESETAEVKVREALEALGLGRVDYGTWKATTGLLVGRADGAVEPKQKARDLIDALDVILNATPERPMIGVFHHVRQFVSNYQIIQKLIDATLAARISGSHIIMVGPALDLPVELKNLITFVDIPLPTKEQIQEQFARIARAYADEVDLPEDQADYDKLIAAAANAAVGLDTIGAENAISLSLATAAAIDLSIVQSQKEQQVRQSDVLEFVDTRENMSHVGGFDVLKTWLSRRQRVFTPEARDYGLSYPKGILIVGPAGCLAGDTVLPFRRGKRNSGRQITVEDAYHKFNGIPRDGRRSGSKYLWDRSLPTQTLSVMDDGVVGYNEVREIVYTGEKETFTVTASNGKALTVSAEHPFRRPDGSYTPLSELVVGDTVMVRDMRAGTGRTVFSNNRRVVESVPFHPNAYDHWVGYESYDDFVEYNYKRINYAVLLYEANLNRMPVEELIRILRHDPERAAKLEYVPKGTVIHHIDFDCTNDRLENLQALAKSEHDALHGQYNRKNMRYSTLVQATIESIVSAGVQKTYDLIMANPHRNYMAHEFAVHNTGKSLVAKATASYLGLPCLRLDMGKIFKSLVGESESSVRLALKVAEAVSPVVLWVSKLAQFKPCELLETP